MDAKNPREVLAYVPHSREKIRLLTAPLRHFFSPVFLDLEKLDLSRPALWVGNHTLLGLTDVPLLFERLYVKHNVVLRSLGDRLHLKVPFWGDFLVSHGMVLGDPEVGAELMRGQQHILVFPGGGREVMRRKGESYQLLWKQRLGFVRLAAQHGYDIIPFGSVGADESYRILIDANDILAGRFRRQFLERSGLLTLLRGGDFIPPLVMGLGGTLIPRPQRYYFGFGARIPTAQLHGNVDDKQALWQIREKVAHAVRAQISALLEYRKTDRATWSPLRRFLAPIDGNDTDS